MMQTRLELYQRVTPLARLGIWEYNLVTRVTYWNTIIWEIYEMEQQAVPPNDFVASFYHDEPTFHALIQRAMKTIEPQQGEFKIKTHLGNQKWVRLRVHAIGREGVCEQLYGTLEDTTEQKQLEEERGITLQMLSEQNGRLTNFAHIVSHNLRTHTGNIKTLAELIPIEQNEEEKLNMLSMLSGQATNLLKSLEHLNEVVDVYHKTFSKVEDLRLLESVQHVLYMLNDLLQKHRAQVDVIIPVEIVVRHKTAYLESIIMNLITNAVKYCSLERNCRISVRSFCEADKVVLEVEDNGMGIDLHQHGSRLFGLYNTFHKNADAHGIGLYLVKTQVEALGGKIEVKSDPGIGTIFSIHFAG